MFIAYDEGKDVLLSFLNAILESAAWLQTQTLKATGLPPASGSTICAATTLQVMINVLF